MTEEVWEEGGMEVIAEVSAAVAPQAPAVVASKVIASIGAKASSAGKGSGSGKAKPAPAGGMKCIRSFFDKK